MIDDELARRLKLWEQIRKRYRNKRIPPTELHNLEIYGGAQGIWRDVDKTADLTESRCGITVGVLHTGEYYSDSLSSDGVLYHYPRTNRPPSVDRNEIEATKEAGKSNLPIFVVSHNPDKDSLRDVYLGWVAGWDDKSEMFLILFSEAAPEKLLINADIEDEVGFELFDKQSTKRGWRKLRPNQAKFQFQVFQRYGTKCALCHVEIKELLEAVHIVPKSEHGSDDPRNGLVLCVLHHKAFDANLFGIKPKTTRIYYPSSSITKSMLGIRFDDLTHLSLLPHQDALEWNWTQLQDIWNSNKS